MSSTDMKEVREYLFTNDGFLNTIEKMFFHQSNIRP
jgi:hypothetical protein